MTRTTIRSEDITDGQVKAADIASGAVDTTGLEDDIALLGFKVASNGSLAKYNLVDQVIDAFEDASGVDASASTDEIRDSSNYYSGTSAGAVTATGGTITTDGDYTVHKFTADGTFTTDTAQDVEYLVVGGGGSGAGLYGAGGAGGYRAATGFAVTATSYTIQVGVGGVAVEPIATNGNSGEDSIFSTITSTGGGYGGSQTAGGSGGSGGGGGGYAGSFGGGDGNTPSTSPSQGNNGGGGTSTGVGGGGGGASEAGNPSGKNGGDGIANDIIETGVDVTYAGGGGGGSYSGTQGSGGAGGGGSGGIGGSNGGTGGANTGGGGGGGGHDSSYSGAGGTGIVVIRRPTTNPVYNNMTLVSNAQTAQAQPGTARITLFEHPSTGTTIVNTDIKAYASRDNGTTYTQITLTDDGDYESGKKLLSGSADISGQPAGTSMRYKIETLNQSSSKITRLHGVSLQWA